MKKILISISCSTIQKSKLKAFLVSLRKRSCVVDPMNLHKDKFIGMSITLQYPDTFRLIKDERLAIEDELHTIFPPPRRGKKKSKTSQVKYSVCEAEDHCC